MLEWLLVGFFLLSFLFIAAVWITKVYPHNLIAALFRGGKKEWWQDRMKRIEKENESIKKAKKG